MDNEIASNKKETVSYIKNMLRELRTVSESVNCGMLCYLIEMAYVEASETEEMIDVSKPIGNDGDEASGFSI